MDRLLGHASFKGGCFYFGEMNDCSFSLQAVLVWKRMQQLTLTCITAQTASFFMGHLLVSSGFAVMISFLPYDMVIMGEYLSPHGCDLIAIHCSDSFVLKNF